MKQQIKEMRMAEYHRQQKERLNEYQSIKAHKENEKKKHDQEV